MEEYVPEKTPICKACGKKLWYDHTLTDGKEEWVCPNRWIGPNLLKWKPRDPEWEKHTAAVRPPKQQDLESLSNSPESLSVKAYLELALPGVIRK